MNWDVVNAIAESVGALGVLITLAYLAVQIRDARKLLLANSHQARTDRNIQLYLARTQDPVLFRASQKAVAGEALTEEELWHYGQFFQAILRHFEELHYQRELGLIDDTTWAANLGGIKTFVSPPLAGDILSQTSHMFREPFMDLVFQIREQNA